MEAIALREKHHQEVMQPLSTRALVAPGSTQFATMMKKATAEALGTALLLTAVIGSGITGARLAGGNLAIALLANALVAGAALTVLTMTLRPVSGAHFNPVVTFAEASRGKISWRAVPIYVVAQLLGAVGGVVIAHLTLGEPAVTLSTHERSSLAEMVSELVATFGLLAVLIGCSRQRSEAVPFAVGAYVATAHWFTASASFANPVVTVARALTDSFAGTRLIDVPGLIVSQAVGGALATIVICWLIPAPRIELTAPELKREQLADDQARQAAVFLDSDLRVEKPTHVRV